MILRLTLSFLTAGLQSPKVGRIHA